MEEKKVTDRPGFVRLGMFVTSEASDALDALCKELDIGQAEVLEAAVLFLPKRSDLLEAIEAAKSARKASKAKRLGMKRELAKLSPEELAKLLALRGSGE